MTGPRPRTLLWISVGLGLLSLSATVWAAQRSAHHRWA